MAETKTKKGKHIHKPHTTHAKHIHTIKLNLHGVFKQQPKITTK